MIDRLRKIELLAPARDLISGCTAIDFGADAVYIGGPRFGARAAAPNSVEDIERLVRYAHGFSARVYVVMNTVIFEEELSEAQRVAEQMVEAGVDALIVQDMAFTQMGLTEIELHASTQTQNSSIERVQFLEKCGFSRVILERGLTLEQIQHIRAATTVELETFIHGAICVGNSGRCYLSRSMSSRSGNRGECAQPCRLPYDLVDGTGNTLVNRKYLLSLKDMNLTESVSDLLNAGITSLKIEGRLKDISYVKNIVSHYRHEIDRAMEGTMMERSSDGHTIYDFTPAPEKSFSRGSTQYYLHGKRSGVASLNTPKATGEPIGQVTALKAEGFLISGSTQLAPGDGICFVTPAGELQGTNINSIKGALVIPNKTDNIAPGTELFRNHDHRFEAVLDSSRTRRVIGVQAEVKLSLYVVELTLTDNQNNAVCTSATGAFDLSRNGAKMQRSVVEQISKSGEMPFEVTAVNIVCEEGQMPFIPISQLNALRREAMEMLWEKRFVTRPEMHIPTPDLTYPFPVRSVDGSENVTNSLSEKFYRIHGVEQIEPGYDLSGDLRNVEVMRTPYCIRREIGQCLKENPSMREPLEIRRGSSVYRLEFDCAKCEMKVILL